jgi:hypothetical protein
VAEQGGLKDLGHFGLVAAADLVDAPHLFCILKTVASEPGQKENHE